jgi:hypothetical protein
MEGTPVFSRVRLLTIGALCALVLVGLSVTSAEAAIAKVGGITSAGQDYYNAKLKARWKAVPGATYQVRWAASTSGLARAVPVAARTPGATSPALNRCLTNYVQVRAVKGTAVGPWSKPKGLKFAAKRPAVAKLSGVGLDNAVQFKWNYVPYSTRYRVRWNPAPFGKFPGAETFVGGGWLPQSARSATLQLPTTPKAGDKMTGVAYANAVFAQIETNNACKPAGLPKSTYIPVFPKAPDPGTGDKIRFGTYNVELFPETGPRIAAIADNIADHGVQVLALQEANRYTAAALQSRLGALWSTVPAIVNSSQQIMYRNDKFQLASNGSFNVPNPKSGASDLVTPWAKLDQVKPSDPAKSQSLMVVAIHFAENPSASDLSQKASTGAAAAVAIRNINAIAPADMPVISAGDFRYMREPFCDEPTCRVEAPPTFVRSGYYDAMAAVTKVNFQYTTVNGHTKTYQAVSSSGVGTRSDYIMLKNFKGSVRYENVVNRFMPGTIKVTPTDHNLILADVVIPYTP